MPLNLDIPPSLAGGNTSTEQSPRVMFLLDALTDSLQRAFEAAVLPNRFEIDEQEPLSRLEALTEELVRAASSFASPDASEVNKVAAKSTTIFIIYEIASRIRSTIQVKDQSTAQSANSVGGARQRSNSANNQSDATAEDV